MGPLLVGDAPISVECQRLKLHPSMQGSWEPDFFVADWQVRPALGQLERGDLVISVEAMIGILHPGAPPPIPSGPSGAASTVPPPSRSVPAGEGR